MSINHLIEYLAEQHNDISVIFPLGVAGTGEILEYSTQFNVVPWRGTTHFPIKFLSKNAKNLSTKYQQLLLGLITLFTEMGKRCSAIRSANNCPKMLGSVWSVVLKSFIDVKPTRTGKINTLSIRRGGGLQIFF